MTFAEKYTSESVTTNDEEAAAQSDATVACKENAIVMENYSVASTSRNGKQLPEWKSCWNCGGEMSVAHQCDTLVDTSGKSTPASTALCGLTTMSVPSFKGVAAMSPPRWKVPGPSAPVILKKPVKMLDGSPIWTPKTRK